MDWMEWSVPGPRSPGKKIWPSGTGPPRLFLGRGRPVRYGTGSVVSDRPFPGDGRGESRPAAECVQAPRRLGFLVTKGGDSVTHSDCTRRLRR